MYDKVLGNGTIACLGLATEVAIGRENNYPLFSNFIPQIPHELSRIFLKTPTSLKLPASSHPNLTIFKPNNKHINHHHEKALPSYRHPCCHCCWFSRSSSFLCYLR